MPIELRLIKLLEFGYTWYPAYHVYHRSVYCCAVYGICTR